MSNGVYFAGWEPCPPEVMERSDIHSAITWVALGLVAALFVWLTIRQKNWQYRIVMIICGLLALGATFAISLYIYFNVLDLPISC